MYQLIIVLISIVLSAAMVTATAIYAPSMRGTTDLTYELTKEGLGTLEKSYRLFTSSNAGGTPALGSGPDGGLSNFGEYLPFTPQAPKGYQWDYGYNSSAGMNYFCLYSTDRQAANSGVLKAFTRLQKIFASTQYVIAAGGQANCGSTTSLDTSTGPTDVSITYFVKNVESFSPKAIPGLVLWLDADDPGTLSLSGANVATWLDKSGYGNNAVQNITSYMPTYVSTGFRGRGALTFARALYSYMEVPFASSLAASSVDVFVAGSLTSNGAQSTLVSSNTAASCSTPCYTYTLRQADQGSGYPVDSGIQFSTTNGAATANVEPTAATSALNTPAMWEGFSGGAVQGVLQNGTGATTNANMGAPTYNLEVGRGPSAVQGQYLDGVIGEIVVYNRALSAAERTRLQHYFGRKWALSSLTN